MKKSIAFKLGIVFILILFVVFFLKSCIIHNPKPEECEIVTTKIVEIREGSTYDIQFRGNKGDSYYINRGLEQGLNLDTLNALVLNKTVTLHLPKMIYGPSKHIAQLAIEDHIVFTEFD